MTAPGKWSFGNDACFHLKTTEISFHTESQKSFGAHPSKKASVYAFSTRATPYKPGLSRKYAAAKDFCCAAPGS